MELPRDFNAVAETLRLARKIAVFVVGVTVLLIGGALVVLPGPAFVVIPLGLGILATEFLWARRILHKLRDGAKRVLGRATTEKQET